MKHIYIDWNIFTSIKNPGKELFISLANKLLEIKSQVSIPYSSAHLSDLKKGYREEEPYISYTNRDLQFISKLTNNIHWYYNEKENALWTEESDPIEVFERYKDNYISAEEAMDFEKTIGSLEGMEGLGTLLNDIFKSIQVPMDLSMIPDDSELKKPLMDIFKPTGPTTSMLDLMKNFGNFSDEIHKDPTKYKELRNGFRGALKLPTDISNWNNKTWDSLDEHMSGTLLNKSFSEMVSDATKQQNKDKEITFHSIFLHAYNSLDMVGYKPEELNKKNTYTNFQNDSQHAFYAAYCDIFITNDDSTRAKAKAIYEKYNIPTEILTAEEFLNKSI